MPAAPASTRPLRVFLTGASSGIGAALAAAYAAQGAILGLVARRPIDQGPLQGAARILCYAVDVTDAAALRAAAGDFIAAAGVPDIVIANAGISVGTLTEFASDQPVFKRIIDTNLIALVDTFGPFIGPMRAACARELGYAPRLVGIASVAGVRGLPGSEAYSASKAAAISYCESLRVELRGSGIRVVTILPGFIATPMTARNPYPMPFLMPVDAFARRAVRVIARGASRAVIPWPMAIVARLLALLPNGLYDALFAKAGQKPRATTGD